MNDTLLYPTLRDVCAVEQPKKYLEIGVRDGDSLRVVVEAAKPDLLVLCDTWGPHCGGTGRGSHQHINRMLQELRYGGKVIYLDDDSHIMIPRLTINDFNLILVDGDHSKEGCYKDMANSWVHLAPDGLMIVDDLTHPAHPGIREAVGDFCLEYDPGIRSVTWDKRKKHGVVTIRRKRGDE